MHRLIPKLDPPGEAVVSREQLQDLLRMNYGSVVMQSPPNIVQEKRLHDTV